MLSDPDTKIIIKENLDKNFKFKYLYSITRDRVIEEINNLKITDFYEKVKSRNIKHLNEYLYI